MVEERNNVFVDISLRTTAKKAKRQSASLLALALMSYVWLFLTANGQKLLFPLVNCDPELTYDYWLLNGIFGPPH